MEQNSPAVEGPFERQVRPHCSHCRFPLPASDSGLRHYGTHAAHQESECLRLLHAEIARLTGVVKKANDQAEHFERLWYLAKEDAERYAFAKTLEGQVVTMETFKVRGSAELDQALDDAMAEDADARNEAGYAA
jgi:hypothetical protein